MKVSESILARNPVVNYTFFLNQCALIYLNFAYLTASWLALQQFFYTCNNPMTTMNLTLQRRCSALTILHYSKLWLHILGRIFNTICIFYESPNSDLILYMYT